ncbi:leukotoxin LktA family filamentous adhesin [Candidatus Litorirhabdus singularis]|nr:leukotoxin LktA family filamentous adhesin [Candidatus Litorirhabdus singularis]
MRKVLEEENLPLTPSASLTRNPKSLRPLSRAVAEVCAGLRGKRSLPRSVGWGLLLSSGAMHAVAVDHNIAVDGATAKYDPVGTGGKSFQITNDNVKAGIPVNVFKHFVVGTGNTVKLVVPADASKLVNIVKDSQPAVHGILNSYKNGALGGDVVFASSHGFLVGESGIVNVGSLTVRTPTAVDIDSLIDAPARLLEGPEAYSLAVSPSGLISISGKINAKTSVDLHGHTVTVAGSITVGNARQASYVSLADVMAVNVGDYTAPVALKSDGGTIRIVGADNVARPQDSGSSDIGVDVKIAGALLADGGITISAEDFSLVSGGQIDARRTVVPADGGADVGGNVRIDAIAESGVGFGLAEAGTSISLNGSIWGDEIVASASSSAVSSWFDESAVVPVFELSQSLITGLSAYYLAADASARVEVGSNANLQAGGDISLESESLSWTQATSIPLSAGGAFSQASLAAIYASSDANSETRVKTGATLNAGGQITVESHNEAGMLASAVDLIADDANVAVMAIAIGESDVNSTAIIETGAIVTGNGLEVAAENQNYYEVTATAAGLKNTSYGLAVAVGDFDTNATAELGASFNPDDAGGVRTANGNVTITALDRTVNQIVQSGVTVGSPALLRTKALKGLVNGLGKVQNYLTGNLTKLPDGTSVPKNSQGKVDLKGGLAFTLNLSDHEAYAYLGTNVEGQNAAPTVATSGGVAVIAQTDLGTDNVAIAGGNPNAAQGEDQGAWRTSAESAIASPEEVSNQSEASLSVAVNIATNTSDAVAEIGDSVTVDASGVAVQARQKVPAVSTYDKFESLAGGLQRLKTFVNGVGGIQSNILTSFANAGADAQTSATGGSVNVVVNDLNTKAWIGDNANITTSSSQPWSVDRVVAGRLRTPGITGSSRPFKEITYSFNFDAAAIDVQAYNLNESINMAGNIGALGLPSGVGANDGGGAVGGSISFIQQNATAVAGVGQATLNAKIGGSLQNVLVKSNTEERHFLITPSSGASSGMGFNGVIAILNGETLNHASLSNQAKVNVAGLEVLADHGFGNWAIAGAASSAKDSAKGIAIAVNITQGDNKAYIGDNSAEAERVEIELESGSRPAPDSPNGPPVERGILANNVTVRSRSGGTNGAISLAGTVSGCTVTTSVDCGPSSTPNQSQTYWNSLKNGLSSAFNSASSGNGDASLNSVTTRARSSEGASSDPSSPSLNANSTGSSGAGSFTVAVNNIDSKAFIQGAIIGSEDRGDDSGEKVEVSVKALEKVISAAVAGSAAVSYLKDANPQPARQNTIAGAIAYQISFNDALAGISDSSINQAGNVSVAALHGGELVSIGLSAAVSKASQTTETNNGALSISGAQIYDGTSARIDNSDIAVSEDDALSVEPENLEVFAYSDSDIGVGGGALYVGGSKGGGLAVTFAEINDPSAMFSAYNEDVYSGAAVEAVINGGSLSNFDEVTVAGSSFNVIGIGAAGGGYSGVENSKGYAGSFAIGSIGADTLADVDGVSIDGVSGLYVNASSQRDEALEQLIDGLGSSTLNQEFDFSGADAIDNSSIYTTESGAESSYDSGLEGKRITAVAGLVQVGDSNVGISYAHADVFSETTASIKNTDVNAEESDTEANTVSVEARDDSLLYSVSVGVGVATGSRAGVGSVAVNRLNNKVIAEIGDWNGVDRGTVKAENVLVAANNAMDLINVAGAVAGSTAGSAGPGLVGAAGLAVAVNLVGTDAHETRARIANTQLLVSGDILVRAISGETNDHNLMVGNAIGVGATNGSNAAFAGAIGVNNIDQLVAASIKDVGTNRDGEVGADEGGAVVVQAYDFTDSVATGWIVALSNGGDSAGAAIGTNRVDSDVTAEVLGDASTRGSTTLKVQDIKVDAARYNELLTINAGVALAKGSALAGSVGTGIIDGNVVARIADQATVSAYNNVLVNADAYSENLVGSGAIGVGVDGNAGALAITTSIEFGKTEAYIADASVDAKGKNAANLLTVDTGELSNYGALLDLSTSGEVEEGDTEAEESSDLLDQATTGFSLLSLEKSSENVSGLVVNATSRTKQQSVSIGGAGASSTALVANVATNVATSTTEARITNSTINMSSADEAGADVRVRASAHEAGLALSAGGAVSLSGSAGIAGFATNSQQKSALATVSNSQINADEVDIAAKSSKVAQAVSAGIAAGAGSGGLGGAASVVITEQAGSTRAWLRGGTVTANELTVQSDRRQEANVAAGSVGIGAKAGIGFGLAVNIVGGDSTALIGNDLSDAGDTRTTAVNVTTVAVDAARFEDVNSYTFGAGVSPGFGGAAMIDVTEFRGETRAAIHGRANSTGGGYSTTLRGKNASDAATTVTVSAQEILRANHAAAGIGVGKVGIGAVANVVLGRSQVYGEIVGSDISAQLLDIDANARREAELLSIAGAAGKFAAAISIGVSMFGQGDTTADDGTNADDEFDGSRVVANSMLGQDTLASNASITAADRAKITATGVSVAAATSGTSNTTTMSGTSLALSGESVTAARISGGRTDVDELNVNSSNRIHSSQSIGAAQVSLAGIAGGIGITRLYDMSIATVDTDLSADTVVVDARAGNLSAADAAAESSSFVGSLGGITVVVNYNDARSEQRVVAGVAGATGSDSGDLTITAVDTTEVRIGSLDAGRPSSVADGDVSVTLGAGAVGVSVGYAEKSGKVDAWLGKAGRSVDGYNNLTIDASSAGLVKATGFGLAGGIGGALQGVITTAEDNAKVTATLDGSVSTGTGLLKLTAQSAPELFSSAFGVTLSGSASMGGSFAYATTNTEAKTVVADGVTFGGFGDVEVRSETGDGSREDYQSTYAAAFAASGGLLLGIAGSEANATNNAQSVAQIGDNVTLPNANFKVLARHTGIQIAESDGYFIGLAAGGYQTGLAQSFTSTRVEFGSNPSYLLGRQGDLILDATSLNENQAFTTAGGGGVFSGNAAESVVDAGDHSSGQFSAAVLLDDWDGIYHELPVDAGNVQITAKTEVSFFAGTSSLTVSAVGGSGAESDVEVDTTARVELGDNVSFEASDIDIDAINEARQIQTPYNSDFGMSINAGGGGGANGSAGLSYQNLKGLAAQVELGDNVKLKVSQLSGALTQRIAIDALTRFNVFDQAVLEVGGALQGAGTESDVDVNVSNTITLKDNVHLENSIGAVGIGAYASGAARSSANVTVWAIAGVAGGVADAYVNVGNIVSVGDDFFVDSIEEISIHAGKSSDGFGQNLVQATASANVYNWTATPIPAGNRARARSYLNNSLVLGDGFSIGSDGDVNIGAIQGTLLASGQGVERNPYLELFSAETKFGSSLVIGDNTLKFGTGTVTAGQYARQLVRVNQNGAIVENLARFGTAAELDDTFSSRGQLEAYIAELDARIAELQAAPVSTSDLSGAAGEALILLATQGAVDSYRGQVQVLLDNVDATADPSYAATLTLELSALDAWLPGDELEVAVIDGSGAGSGGGATTTTSTTGVSPYLAQIEDLRAEKVLLLAVVDDLSAEANRVIEVKDVRASAGNINLVAESITLEGTQEEKRFTALGNATIDIVNESDKHLQLGNLLIANKNGGNVYVSGGASRVVGDILEDLGVRVDPADVDSPYKAGMYIVHDPKGANRLNADVIVNAELRNLLSTVDITVREGDLLQQAVIEAASIDLDVAGTLLLNQPNIDQAYTRSPSSLINFVQRWSPSEVDFVHYYLSDKYSTAIGATNINAFNGWFTGSALGGYNAFGFQGVSPTPYYAAEPYGYDQINVYFNWGFRTDSSAATPSSTFYNFGSDTSRGGTKWGFRAIADKRGELQETASYQDVKNSFTANPNIDVGELTPSGELLVGGKVIINARRLDINGTIRVGRDNNWTANVGTGFDSVISEYVSDLGLVAGDTVELSPGENFTRSFFNPNYQPFTLFPDYDPSFYSVKTYDFDISKTANSEGISLIYDVGTRKLQVEEVPVSGGGYVAIRAAISSTGEDGKIVVKDGLGQISVNNLSNTELVVGKLSPGDNPEGIIRITDLDKDRTKSQWYVHTPGNRIDQYETSATAVSYLDGAYKGSFGGTGETVSTTYTPKQGQLFYFRDSATLKRNVELPPDGYFARHAGVVGSWGYEKDWGGEPDSYRYTDCGAAPGACSNGVAKAFLQHEFERSWERSTGFSAWNLSYAPYYGGALVAADPSIKIAKELHMRSNTYIKADHSIRFEFTGASTGSVSLDSVASLELTGNISNPLGTTSINTDANLILSGNAQITSAITSITANGNIGENGKALKVRSDELSLVSTQGSINFEATALNSNAIEIGELSSLYNIVGVADKSLVARDASTLISADSINLTSRTGSIGQIGTMGQPASHEFLEIDVAGAVTLNAETDIAVSQRDGELSILSIAARNNVVLRADNGSVVNAIGGQAKSAEELAEQAAVWDSLSLLDGSSGDRYVSAYENQFVSRYHGYWLIKLRLSDDSESGFAIDPDFLPGLQARYGVTDVDELTALVKSEYDDSKRWFADQVAEPESFASVDDIIGREQKGVLVGYEYGDLLDGAYDSEFTLEIAESSDWYAQMVEGSQWKQSQLDISISAAALSADAAGQLTDRAPNIVASNINIVANSGSVGENLEAMEFAIDLDNPGTVSDEQKTALLKAGPGDIQQTVDGRTVTLTVAQVDPIKVETNGELNVSARDEIYIESEAALRLGEIHSATNDVRIIVGNEISASAGVINVVGRDVFLANTQGNIGTLGQALSLQVSGALRQAGAVGDLYLTHLGSDLKVGSLEAGGILSLSNDHSILADDSNQFMLASQVFLDSGAFDLGAVDSRLNLTVSGPDGLTINAANAWLNLNGAVTQVLGDIQVAGQFQVDAEAGVGVVGDISADTLTLNAAGALSGTAGASLAAIDAIDITAGSVDLAAVAVSADSGRLEANAGSLRLGDSTLRAGNLDLLATAALSLNGDVEIAAGDLLADAQSIEMLTGTKVVVDGEATLSAIDAVSLQILDVTGDLTVTAAPAALSSGTIELLDVVSAQAIELRANDGIAVQSTLTGSSLMIAAGAGQITGAPGALLRSTVGGVSLSAAGVALSDGVIGSAGDIQITAAEQGVGLGLVTAAGALMVDSAAGIDLTDSVQVAQTLSLESAAGDIAVQSDVTGGSLALAASAGQITATPNALLRSTADGVSLSGAGVAWSDGVIDSAGDIQITAAEQGVGLGLVTATGELVVDSAASIDLTDSVQVAQTVSLESATGDIAVQSDVTGSSLALAASAGQITATPNALLRSTVDGVSLSGAGVAWSDGVIDSAGDIQITAAEQGVGLGLVTATGALMVDSDAAIHLTEDVQIGQSASLQAAEEIEQGNGVTLAAMNSVNLLGSTVKMGRDASLQSGDTLSVDSTQGDAVLALLQAGGDLTVNSAASALFQQVVSSAGNLVVDAKTDVVSAAAMVAEGALMLEAGQHVGLGGTLSSGDALSATAGGDLSIAKSIVAGGELTLLAGAGLVALNGSIDAGSDAIVDSAELVMGRDSYLSTAGKVSIGSVGDMLLSSVSTAWNGEEALSLISGGAIEGRTDSPLHVRASGSDSEGLIMAATGIGSPLVVDMPWLSAQTSTGDINIVAQSGMRSPLMDARNGKVQLQVSGDLVLGDLLGNPYLWVDGTLQADRVVMEEGSIAARQGLAVNQLDLTGGGPVAFESDVIDVQVDSNDAPETRLSLTGFGGGSAESIDLTVRNTAKLRLEQLYTNTGSLQFDGALRLAEGIVDSSLDIESNSLTMRLDNIKPGAINVDAQLLTPYGEFWLAMSGTEVRTDAVVSRFSDPVSLFFAPPEDLLAGVQAVERASILDAFQRLSTENQVQRDLHKQPILPAVSGTQRLQNVSIEGGAIQASFIDTVAGQELPESDYKWLEVSASGGGG